MLYVWYILSLRVNFSYWFSVVVISWDLCVNVAEQLVAAVERVFEWQQHDSSTSTSSSTLHNDVSDSSSLLLDLQNINRDDFVCGEMFVIPIICMLVNLPQLRIAGARLWNSLPPDIIACDTVPRFRRELKTFLFRQSYPSIVF